jgi:hypothetical protein
VPEPTNREASAGGLDIEAVRDLATRARRAFEQGGFELKTLQGFPAGACGDASEMLGQLLDDLGLGRWRYTSFQNMPSHAWLEGDGWIIEITADQFNDWPQYAPAQPDVLVTQDRTWHDQRFPTMTGRRIAGMSYFAADTWGDPARRDFAMLEKRARS